MAKKVAPRKTPTKEAARKTPTKEAQTAPTPRPHSGNLPDLSTAAMLRLSALNLSITTALLQGPPVLLSDEQLLLVDEAVKDAEFLASCYERQARS